VAGKSDETLPQNPYPMHHLKRKSVAQAKGTYDFSRYPQCKGQDGRALERASGVGSRVCPECRGEGSSGEEGGCLLESAALRTGSNGQANARHGSWPEKHRALWAVETSRVGVESECTSRTDRDLVAVAATLPCSHPV
jgi:hypothetical protein